MEGRSRSLGLAKWVRLLHHSTYTRRCTRVGGAGLAHRHVARRAVLMTHLIPLSLISIRYAHAPLRHGLVETHTRPWGRGRVSFIMEGG